MADKPPRDPSRSLPLVGRDAVDPSSVERLIEGDSAAVIDALKGRVGQEPDDDHAWLQLGIAYISIEHWGLAMTALGNAVELDGDNVDARLMFARVLSRLRRPDRAAFQLVQAKRLAPSDVRIAKQLGIAFYDKALFDKALRELQRARELDPNDPRTCYGMGLCHEAKQDIAAALSHYRKALELDPQFAAAGQTLGDALASLGEFAEAIAVFQQVLRANRTNAQAAANIEVLRRGMAELEAHRLLGKSAAALGESTLVKEGALAKEGDHYGGDHAQLRVELHEGRIVQLTLVLRDPEIASGLTDDVFQVSAVNERGEEVSADYATAITLTFLREALGCPMTRAGQLYAILLEEQTATWGGATLSFAEFDGRHGVAATLS